MSAILYIKRPDRPITEEELTAVNGCDEDYVSAECLRDDAAAMLRPLAAALDAQLFDEEDNIC